MDASSVLRKVPGLEEFSVIGCIKVYNLPPRARFLHLMNEGLQAVLKSETMQNHSDSFSSHLRLGKKSFLVVSNTKKESK